MARVTVEERPEFPDDEIEVGMPATLEFYVHRPSERRRGREECVTRRLPATVISLERNDDGLVTSLDLRDETDGTTFRFVRRERLIPCGLCTDPYAGGHRREHLPIWSPIGLRNEKASEWPPCRQCKGTKFVGTREYDWHWRSAPDRPDVITAVRAKEEVRPLLGERLMFPEGEA